MSNYRWVISVVFGLSMICVASAFVGLILLGANMLGATAPLPTPTLVAVELPTETETPEPPPSATALAAPTLTRIVPTRVPATPPPSSTATLLSPTPTPTLVPPYVPPYVPPGPPPPAPPTNTPPPPADAWLGEYYSNPDLQGSPVMVRYDNAITFNWGGGAAGSAVPAENFSVRWSRNAWFSEGQYRFHALVDDGVRIYVDGQLVLDQWTDGAVRELTADRYLPAGQHDLHIEYYDRVGGAQIAVWWDQVNDYPDWRGEYFSTSDLSGMPTSIRNDANIDFDWSSGSPGAGLPADNFSVRWTRTISFDDGWYRFHVTVDDGARAWVDNQIIIDEWHDGPARDAYADYAMTSGAHTLRVEYYERTGGARIRFWWEKLPPANITAWKGEYWANRQLEGNPVAVRNDQAVDFDFGVGAPLPGMPSDDFSIRWTRQVTFDPGIYRFYARADDGIRFYVAGRLVIDQWSDSPGNQVFSVDLPLSGPLILIVEYYDHTGAANVKLWWERTAIAPSLTPTPTATATSLPTSTATRTATPTATRTATPTATRTRTPTATTAAAATATATRTATPTATSSRTPTATSTATPTRTATATLTATSTATATATPTYTSTATATATATQTPTMTMTATATLTTTVTSTPTLTSTATTTFTVPSVPTGVRLNEILVLPQKVDWNKDGAVNKNDQWIELYNAATKAQDVSGWMLTSRGSKGQAWRFPAGTVVPSGGYLLLFRTGTGIVLEERNELVLLFDQNARLVDAVTLPRAKADSSYSRDSAGEWHSDWEASPGVQNSPPPTSVH